ncbi:MAG: hypothetical protein NC543_06640 [bacterium]|nr:hypothetical protein [bacterium]
MERWFGISYLFTPTPSANEISVRGSITYNPIAIYEEKGEQVKTMQSATDFQISSSDIATDYMFLEKKNSLYQEMQKRSRAAQERIISEYICTIILDKVREYPEDDLTFLIRDEFESEKIIGRLGYLGLPMQRLHIMFVSYHLASFMGNYIEHYSVPPKSDLHLLFQDKYRGKILGPYPDDDGVTMLKTYYCSYDDTDIYPIRINLFSQMLKKDTLDQEKEHIQKVFMQFEGMEAWPITGGKGSEKTRLPAILADCENYIEGEKKKYE